MYANSNIRRANYIHYVTMQLMTFILYSNNLWTIQTKRWTWQIYEWQNLME